VDRTLHLDSELGRNQAQELLDFLEKAPTTPIDDEGRQFVNGDRESGTHKSILVVSNLRRAIATATYGVFDCRQARSGQWVW
jgi:hypothetical protein